MEIISTRDITSILLRLKYLNIQGKPLREVVTRRHEVTFQRIDLNKEDQTTYKSWTSSLGISTDTTRIFVVCDARDNSVDAMNTVSRGKDIRKQYKYHSVLDIE